MPELNDFLKKMKQFYKTNPAPDAGQMSEFIKDYAAEQGERYVYELPNGGSFQCGAAADSGDIPKYSPNTLRKLARLLCEINAQLPPKPCIKLTPVREKTSVFDSKLGGVPYLPKNVGYPRVRGGSMAGKPLRFLAQLNFSTLPRLPGFPEKGILQFYAGCDGDDVVGVDFDDYFNQNRFRVIYHENVISDTEQLISAEDLPRFDPEEYCPFKGEFLLKPSQPALSPVTAEDFQFDSALIECYNRIFGGSITALWGKDGLASRDEPLYDAIYDSFSQCGSRIGGYPYFTQSDPRMAEEYSGCDTMLFQLDSEGSGEDEIIWGDCGVGAFFISSEDLKKRDFSRVLYSWDCC